MTSRQERIALFGGSFDPIHKAHIAVARAAMRRFRLDRVIFIPSGIPPHKPKRRLASFADRFAMAALACSGNPKFTVSSIESGPNQMGDRVYYSVDTVREFRKNLNGEDAQLFFILGADQFLTLPSWKDYESLLEMCNFIVANRPGFDLDRLYSVIPARMLDVRGAQRKYSPPGSIPLKRTSVCPLTTVASEVSATDIRARIRAGRSIAGLVPRRVQEYIEKQGLYR